MKGLISMCVMNGGEIIKFMYILPHNFALLEYIVYTFFELSRKLQAEYKINMK